MTDKKLFFIMSMPRCRSTWFANFFTYKKSFCYNEEGRYMSSLDDLYERIDRRDEEYIGFSDPEMFHYIESIYQMFPNAKYIFLERDAEECKNSLHKISGIPMEMMDYKFKVWQKNIDFLKNNINHFNLNFYDMDNVDIIKNVQNYIMPDVKFDVDRYNLLTSMLIKVTISEKPSDPLDNCISPYFNYSHPLFQTSTLG